MSPVYKLYEKRLLSQVRKGPVPNHLAVIMDGNRRYAESLGLHPNEGHIVGKSTLENLSEWCRNLNIRYLTVYAFSLENFRRNEEELEALMDLFEESFRNAGEDPRVHENKVRVRALGHRELLPDRVVVNSKGNLEHFGLEGKIKKGDVEESKNQSFEAIVTDPPYGIASSTGGEKISELLQRTMNIFSEAMEKGKRIVMAISNPELIQTTNFKKIYQFEWYIHKSLTRHIMVLEKTNN